MVDFALLLTAMNSGRCHDQRLGWLVAAADDGSKVYFSDFGAGGITIPTNFMCERLGWAITWLAMTDHWEEGCTGAQIEHGRFTKSD